MPPKPLKHANCGGILVRLDPGAYRCNVCGEELHFSTPRLASPIFRRPDTMTWQATKKSPRIK